MGSGGSQIRQAVSIIYRRRNRAHSHENDPKMPEQLKQEGVLFIYNGTETCFWPPQTSG